VQGGSVVSIDPWALAAACDRVLLRETDPRRRIATRRVRDLWLALGTQQARHIAARSGLQPDPAYMQFPGEIARVRKLQRGLQRTLKVIEQGNKAYQQSVELLERYRNKTPRV
jgi:hypothetical protein